MSASTRSHPESRQFPGNCSLEKALDAIVGIFHRYTAREGDLDRLSFEEFKTLLTEQAPNFLKACERNRSGYMNKLFEETDLNHDNDLSFEEFVTVLSKLTDDAHRISHHSNRCGPDQD